MEKNQEKYECTTNDKINVNARKRRKTDEFLFLDNKKPAFTGRTHASHVSRTRTQHPFPRRQPRCDTLFILFERSGNVVVEKQIFITNKHYCLASCIHQIYEEAGK